MKSAPTFVQYIFKLSCVINKMPVIKSWSNLSLILMKYQFIGKMHLGTKIFFAKWILISYFETFNHCFWILWQIVFVDTLLQKLFYSMQNSSVHIISFVYLFVQSYLFIRFRTFFNLYSNFNIIDAKTYEMK